jgi:serine-type D-Ala-D-Ala carboxypeptidase
MPFGVEIDVQEVKASEATHSRPGTPMLRTYPGSTTAPLSGREILGQRTALGPALRNPELTIGRQHLVFPAELSTGDRLVFDGSKCRLYRKTNSEPEWIQPQGAPATLQPGRNRVVLSFGSDLPPQFRVAVSLVKHYPESNLPESERQPPAEAESIPRAVQQEIDAGLFPGAVVLVGRPGQVLYKEAFGDAQIVPDKFKMHTDHIFDLASVTKVVATGTAFGICVDDGRIRFDTPIAQALPELSGRGIESITVEHLATHTSGFDNAKYWQRAQGEAMLELMLGASPQWKPGSRFYYSCLNMILLGRMVEHASGQRLDAFCQARIFRPLGMHDTAFGPLCRSPRVVPSGAPEIGQIEDEQARVAGRPVGNAGLFSTAGDLARFCEMMLGGGRLGDVRILSQESHRRMTRNQLAPPLPAHGFAWDMDLHASHRPSRLSEKAYGHSGHTGQSIWIDPEKQVYLIVLTNRNHPKRIDGERKTQQYQARARIGDAALRLLGY